MEERLQKIIASAGIASRRHAEKLIIDGRVTVNHVVVKQLGVKADPEGDEIRVDGKLILPVLSKIYLVLNKPRGYVTTLHDPEGRPIVTDLLGEVSDRVFPVGRLDYESEGLLILTNDGDFSQRLQHPRFNVPKTYQVKIEGSLTDHEFQSLLKGIQLDDGIFKPNHVQIMKKGTKTTWLTLIISGGRNRVIRRGFEALNHSVLRLIRVGISDLGLGNLKTGAYRYLMKEEVKGVLSFSKTMDF
jgi:23S rRNA pseudouridine2605 synthase